MTKKNLVLLLLCLICGSASRLAAAEWRPAERWRGFNLLGMFVKGWGQPGFHEEDFQMIHELGFNFVRLPMDYRYWIVDNDWERIDEEKVKLIDQAVAWGKKYNIHVQICFHRAPGYTVANPPEKTDLFTDADAQRVCAKHWAFFARRYKGIPNEEVSFDLFNEPGEQSPESYAKVARLLIEAIHKEDPNRFIIADGRKWGGEPLKEIFDQKGLVGQAMRGYRPMSISHYKASWIHPMITTDPVWPPPQAVSPLYSPGKAPLNVPFVIQDAPAGEWAIMPGNVSDKARFVLDADGVRVMDTTLKCAPGAGWTNVVYHKEWKISQGRCLTPMKATLVKPAKRLSLRITEGDWAEVQRISVTAGGKTAELPFEIAWGRTNGVFRFAGWDARPAIVSAGGAADGRMYLMREMIDPWQPARDAGVFTMVGEFGAFNQTPHPVVMAWMEDQLKLWKEYNLGWAMWNFTGSIGVLDSGRDDVRYEDFHGHKLDRQMLDLLQKY
jgi:aryl-phospho-beta-D-glucosidase BglC (GH1 family)